ncbi:hypothetical protein [Natrinema hispanicum]|uniref:Uncharacterized protein n=1 Tax=Natrinema hispanicum TaxID=392421 RepID=A0A1I0IXB1_9EURY|nr:hypothetical protein [Natrinema hispanicum]SDE02044.1 hypothetical protein SAMN05192552_11032 [Natrinema hispanicum]SEU01777.1 hypothetical protein SAMN04488694_1275 [Natrinema hispanicum]
MTENTNRDDGGIARRAVLASLGVSTAALAGCTSGTSTDPSNTSNSTDGGGISAEGSDVFTSIEMGDTTLEIEVADDASVELINLIDPNGELFDQQRLASGETTTSFEILGRYEDSVPTGDYELVALDGDEQVDTTTLTLEAECTITDVLWAAENPDMEWDKNSPDWDEYAAVVIENTGTIPSLLTELRWRSSPVARLLSKESQSYYHEAHLPPGKTTVYSKGSVYATDGAVHSLDCDELGTEPMTVTAHVQVGSNPSYTQEIKYGDSQSCEITIVDGSTGTSISSGGEN